VTRLRLTGGTVVRSLDPVVVEETDLVVDDGRIQPAPGRAVDGPDRAALDTVASAEPRTTIDCSGCLVIPGNVCAHTHAYSALARGMPYRLEPPATFLETLRRVWWRLDRALDAPSIRASAMVAAMEALLSGTTTLVDHHASPHAVDGSLDLIADAFARLGVRSILCYETSDRDGPAIAEAGLRENRRFAARAAAGAFPAARAMIGAHASFTLSDATLEECAGAARDAAIGLHVHVAEDAADERDSLDRRGIRVVERLAEADALDGRSLLAHGVWLDDGELDLVEAAGSTVVHNARSNMNNRVGNAPLARLGPSVALGTDGIGADMFEESRVAYLDARAAGSVDDPAWPLACLAAGARVAAAAFAEPDLGRLVPGAPADIVVLDYAAPTPVRPDALAGHWVFGLSARAVRDVVVAGRLVVRDRCLVGVDQAALVAEARAQADALWRRLDDIGEHPFDPRRGGPMGVRAVEGGAA
jgi:putative selenium metabolism protein SsnA